MAETPSDARGPTEHLFARPQDRANRVRHAKLQVLYRGAFAIPTNFLVGGVVLYFLRDSYPGWILAAWGFATIAVAAARLELNRRFQRNADPGRDEGHWGLYFCLGSLASGILWGLLCLLLPLYGRPDDFVLLTLVGAGMTAGALTTLSSYYRAFISYVIPFALALAFVSFLQPDAQIAGNGALILLYMVMVSIAAKKLNMAVSQTIELQIDNEALNTSLRRARTERDTARSEKWSTMAHLSHELRTPLNAILGFAQTMRAQIFGPIGNPRYAEYVDDIHASGEQLLQLTKEILQLSQSETGVLTLAESPVDIRRLGAECLQGLADAAQSANVALVNTIPQDLPLLNGDEAKLRQMIFNLAGNAIKFARERGRVTIGGALSGGGAIVLHVQDDGIGMTGEEIDIALAPFGRVADPLTHGTGGIGLGLPVTKRLAELHGGQLSIESCPDHGTTCTIMFPPARTVPRAADTGCAAETERAARMPRPASAT